MTPSRLRGPSHSDDDPSLWPPASPVGWRAHSPTMDVPESVGLHVRRDMCAAIVRDEMGRSNGNCTEPPTRRGTWRFDYPQRHVMRVLLCDGHAAELADDERLTIAR